jgi:hypothetical protein
MRNILSYQNGCFTGKEIIDWAEYQVINKTSHRKAGGHILKYYYNLHLNKVYKIKTSYCGPGYGETIHKNPCIYN